LQLEAELAEMPARRGGGVPRRRRVCSRRGCRQARDALDLITFLSPRARRRRERGRYGTVNRLWMQPARSTRTIARGFIRCEVVDWHDLVELGSHAEVARQGKQRLEGKTYVVRDGDVLNIRFNV